MSNLTQRLIAGVMGGLAGLVIACGHGPEDSKDVGSDACVSCSKPDAGFHLDSGHPDTGYVPDANYPQLDAGCNPNCPTPDVGQSGDGGSQYDGGSNPIHLIIEAQDATGNVRGSTETGSIGSFRVNENIFFDLNKSYRENCGNQCGQSKGMGYCDWSTDYVSGNLFFPPNGNGKTRLRFPHAGQVENFHIVCYTHAEEMAESSTQVNIID